MKTNIEIEIVIKIKDVELRLTISEAKELIDKLHEALPSPVVTHPHKNPWDDTNPSPVPLWPYDYDKTVPTCPPWPRTDPGPTWLSDIKCNDYTFGPTR